MPYGVDGEVYIPVDKYGRILCWNNDGTRFTPWWVDGDNPAWFDDAADLVLVNAMRDHGYVDALQSDGDTRHPFTVNLDGQTETITWDEATKDFTVNIPLWQNAQSNLVYKGYALDNGSVISVVTDENNGGPCTVDFGDGNTKVLIVSYDNDEQYLTFDDLTDYPELERDVAGLHELDVFESTLADSGDTIVIVNNMGDGDTFVLVVNQDGYYRDGSAKVPIWSKQLTAVSKSGQYSYLGDASGSVISLDNGTGNPQIVQVNYDQQVKRFTWGDIVSNVGPEYNVINVPASTSDGGMNWDFTYLGENYHLSAYNEDWLTPNNVIKFNA